MARTSEIQLVVSAKDEASSTLKKVGSSLSTLGNAAKTVAKGIGIAGGALIGFGVSSVKAFAESEKAMASMNATLATMGDKGEQAREGILKAADAAVQLAFDDEDAALSITNFYKATGDLNEANRLNAIAMDISAKKGIELADANRLVNMILAGNTKELKAQGFAVDENATAMQNLKTIEEAYHGQAQKNAETTAGKMKIAQIQFTNFKESIGQVVVTGTGLNEWLNKLTSYLASEKGQQAMKTLGTAITVTINAIIASIKWLNNYLETAFTEMFMLIDSGKKRWNDLKTSVSTAVNGIISSWNSLRSALSKPIDGIVSIAQKISGKLSGKALGGPVMSGTPYLVGERRPEVFVPSQSGNIRQVGEGGGGQTVTVNFNGVNVRSDYDLQEIIRAVKESIARTQNMERFGIRTL